VLAAALVWIACKGDPTDSLRNGIDQLQADPSALFLRPDSVKTLIVSAADEQGNALGTKFTVGTVTSGITVAEDDSFGLVFNNAGNLVKPTNPTRVQYIVTATGKVGDNSFVVRAGGKSLTIPVHILPDSVNTPIVSTGITAVGDTAAVTAGTQFRFMATSTVKVGATTAFVAGFSADSATIKFVPAPGSHGVVSVTNTSTVYAPTVPIKTSVTVAPDTLLVPALPNVTFAPAVANAGDTITVTAPGAMRFTSTSAVSIPASGGATASVSADSLTYKFIAGPNAAAAISVSGAVISGAPTLGKFTLTSGAATLTTPALPSFPATLSNAAPAINDTITITAGAGFKFLPNASISTGANALIISRAPDSSAISFVPAPGTTSGPPVVTGVVLDYLTTVPLTVPASVSLTVPAAIPGANAVATAPTLAIPPTGETSTYADFGAFATAAECGNIGNHCRFYKLVLAAPTTFTASLRWGNTADIGGYFIDAAGNDQFGDFACDAKGSGTGGQPETCSETLPAGTWYLALADFTGAAQNTSVYITLTGQ
jgi:hypothetical protein